MIARATLVILGMILGSFFVVSCAPSYAHGDNARYERILARLDSMDARLATMDAQLGEAAAPSATATFCISQGRGLNLDAAWGVGVKVEGELGGGWPNVLHVNAKAKVETPTSIIPTEAKIGIGGSLGRGMDVCVDVPVTLAPDDQARLDQIALDINEPRFDAGILQKSKFQRRAGRIINYAAVRVPGNQRTLELQRKMQQTGQFAVAQTDDEAESEFDRADDTGEALLDGGFAGTEHEGIGLFGDGRIVDLMAAMELPVGVTDLIGSPERVFDKLPELRNGEGPIFCNQLGISGEIRSRRPRIDDLCTRLADLPAFDRTRTAIDAVHDMFEGINNLMEPLFDNVHENTDNRRARFCQTDVGQRRAFDRYCGR